jgi:hypothetical protein
MHSLRCDALLLERFEVAKHSKIVGFGAAGREYDFFRTTAKYVCYTVAS